MARRALGALLAALVVFVHSSAAAQGDDLQQKLRELERMQERRTQTEVELKKTQAAISEKRSQLTELRTDLDRAKAELGRITNELKAAQQELVEAEAALEQALAEMQKRQGLLALRVRALHEHGRVSYLDVLLGARTFSDFLTRLSLLKTVIAKDAELFRDIKRDREVREEKRNAVRKKRDELQELQLAQASRTNEIAYKANLEGAVIRQLSDEEQMLKARLDAFDREIQASKSEVANLQQRANTPRTGALSMRWPVSPVHLTDRYGMRIHPILGVPRMHTGLDMAANYGQSVFAAEDGVVILSRYYGGYGYTVIVDHGGGIATLYAHNQRLLVADGQRVRKGQTIALAGSTGTSTGPHVHFEVRVQGEPVDPMLYLNR